ncbi:MAG: hypothetical protein HC822_12495 [Oscillochloris sp.]|nr:hypothetical protein [Oscillochloris sp.]
MLADEQIAYEADAILLVEREGDERTITPIIKPPRPAHLKLERNYPAVLATLYPDLAAPTTKGKGKADRQAEEQPEPAEGNTHNAPPRDPSEAEQRFLPATAR